ncbi:Erythronate-4-phosphate dehydrogenase [Candidatus Arsenophonus lipoptenae]|uniref:Erythronate-4-phosphate dehydrogenase n=1 Tax=Candidatus Arsenophonus lipoptenae TaxID=634113 RepID=A0A0X8CXX6_9GAMM|nr:4-phosphoerythronate dehydrogenase [Candidatus Arsenophonus lipoptenae]AMA64917.1 Erythronate-4-phosphate dehydrogenase [Candidatus Arsenophonus lipoptenae]
MNILLDKNIPCATELFKNIGDVKLVSGRSISSSDLVAADALIIRSITQVDEALLKNSNVKFVGTTTSGFDHIDIEWLTQSGIVFSAAPGCNAIAVVEYVLSSLLLLAERYCFDLREKLVGIIGVGHIGSRLNKSLKALGVNTILCDPPRENSGDSSELFWPLEKLIHEADILTFHIPLNNKGLYKSYHLLNDELISIIRDRCILINTSRGSIFDNHALLKALEKGKKLYTVLDVWENEPNISLPLLAKVKIGTAHIAGYSLEGQIRASIQVFVSYSKFLGQIQQVKLNDMLPIQTCNEINFSGTLTQTNLKNLVHFMYNVSYDDVLLRNIIHVDKEFDNLRQLYPKRREWSSVKVNCYDPNISYILKVLGFNTNLI